ncbi:hypothetical protein GCM10028773_13680 [Spirosoma koreense]
MIRAGHTSEEIIEALRNPAFSPEEQQYAVVTVQHPETLMLALEAGAEAGGDKRCGEQRATCAFIRMATPNEKPNKSTLFLESLDKSAGARMPSIY